MAYDGSKDSYTSATSEGNSDEANENGNFECNICLEIATDAVISYCGHLFCWPCLHRWIETRPASPVCPVCKAGIGKDKVIPVYGRDNTERKDPRDKLPPRPQAQRPEPESNYNPFQNFNFGNVFGMGNPQGVGNNNGRFQFSFGVGAFPFAFLSTTFGNNANQAPHDSPQQQEERFLSRAFLWIAVFFLVWLLVA